MGRHGQCTQAERWGTLGSDGEAAHRVSARALGVNLVFIRSQRCEGGGDVSFAFLLEVDKDLRSWKLCEKKFTFLALSLSNLFFLF